MSARAPGSARSAASIIAAFIAGASFFAAPPSSLSQGAGRTGAEERTLSRTATDALDVWDLPTATKAADELERKYPDSIESLEARALVRFHEGRYGDAVKLLDVLAAKGRKDEKSTIVKLIRKTAAQTKDFKEKKGKNFVVRYAPGQDEILVDWTLETLEAQRAAMEKDLGYVPPEIVPVEIYPTGDKFATVTTLTRAEIETSGTIALCKFNRLMVTTPGALSFGYGWRDTLAHEYVHYVVARMTGNKVPIWLHEGLAKYLEVRWRLPKGGERNPTVETVLAEALAKNYFISFDRMHPSIAKLPTAFDATLAFAEVESLIGFSVDRWKNEGLRTLLTGLRDGKPMDVALLDAFGLGLKGLEEEWRVYLKANPPKLHPDLELMPTALKDPKADADASGAAHKGLPEKAGDHLRLGDLLAGEARLDAAIVEYRKARSEAKSGDAKGGHGPIFDQKIANALVLANRNAEAKKALAPLLDTYPTYAPALKSMGRIELGEGNGAKAREFFERSLWQAPFDPETHALLAEACEKTGDAGCATASSARLKRLMQLRQGG